MHTPAKSTGAPAPWLKLGAVASPPRMLRSSPIPKALRSSSKQTSSKPVGGGDRYTGFGRNHVRIFVSTKRNLVNLSKIQFCSGCRNGGEMSMCDHCPRSFCTACVTLPDWHDKDTDFKCPRCHIYSGENGRRAKKLTKYPVRCQCFPVLHLVDQQISMLSTAAPSYGSSSHFATSSLC